MLAPEATFFLCDSWALLAVGLSICLSLLCVYTRCALAQVQGTSPEASGIDVEISDQLLFDDGIRNEDNWDPYTTSFGDGTLALAMNSAVDEWAGVSERGVLVLVNVEGSLRETHGFFRDVGAAWTSPNDTH